MMGFWEFFWLMIWGFLFIAYLMVLFQVIVDVFRDHTTKGWVKALWVVALIFIPALSALIYVIINGQGMTERQLSVAQQSKAATDDYIRSVAATDPATQIANAKALLDSGAISAAEFEQLKAKALA